MSNETEIVKSRMKQLFGLYTPEWIFDDDKPDILAKIAEIFGRQTVENEFIMEQLWSVCRQEFIRMCGVWARPARPASLIAVMKAAEGTNGTFLRKGDMLTAHAKDGEDLYFAGHEDMYVTSADIDSVLSFRSGEDVVSAVRGEFFRADPVTGERERLPEHFPAYEQSVTLYVPALPLMERVIFQTSGEESGQLGRFLRETEIYCLGEDGKFAPDARNEGDRLVIEMTEKAVDERIVVIRKNTDRDVFFDNFTEILDMTPKNPDAAVCEETAVFEEEIEIFGPENALYRSFYISQEELTAIPGEEIELSFDLSFGTYVRTADQSEEEQLRLIKRKKPKRYEKKKVHCFVSEISVEYFNGNGWLPIPLPSDMKYMFADEKNAGKISMRFCVPDNMVTTVQGAQERHFFRFQVKRSDNCFLPEVIFHYPVLKNIQFQRKSGAQNRTVQIVFEQGGSRSDITESFGIGEAVCMFPKQTAGTDMLCVGFHKKPTYGPVSVWIKPGDKGYRNKRALTAYYTDGEKRIQLKITDDTHGMRKEGTVFFLPPSDWVSSDVMGAEKYWLFLEGADSVPKELTVNVGLFKNSIDLPSREYEIENPQPYMEFPVFGRFILKADVWVNEVNRLSRSEMEMLEKEGLYETKTVRDHSGEIDEFYVLWKETKDFDDEAPSARCYILDRRNKIIRFGDGVRLPVPTCTDRTAFTVRVTDCEGKEGNVPAGSVNGFVSTVLRLIDAENPSPGFGGDDPETDEQCFFRGSFLLGSQNRLISREDYEKAALCFSPDVLDSACFYQNDVVHLSFLTKKQIGRIRPVQASVRSNERTV